MCCDMIPKFSFFFFYWVLDESFQCGSAEAGVFQPNYHGLLHARDDWLWPTQTSEGIWASLVVRTLVPTLFCIHFFVEQDLRKLRTFFLHAFWFKIWALFLNEWVHVSLDLACDKCIILAKPCFLCDGASQWHFHDILWVHIYMISALRSFHKYCFISRLRHQHWGIFLSS